VSLNSVGLNSKTATPKCRTADVNDSQESHQLYNYGLFHKG